MISISSTSATMRLQHALERSQALSARAAERLATGYKINSASDDPGGYQVATGLTRQLRGLESANQNVSMGQSIVKLASDGVSNISGLTGEIKDLTLQAMYATDDEKAALELKANALMDQIRNVKDGTKYSDTSVFREEGFKFQVGYTADPSSTLSVETSLEADALNGFDIDTYNVDFTSENADIANTLETFQSLEEDLSKVETSIAVNSSSLEDIAETQETSYASISSARGNIIDTDIAEEAANLARGEILSEFAAALIQQTSEFNSSLALSLISGFSRI